MSTVFDRDAATLRVTDTLQAGHFYRVVWRWHFYAGLFVVPLLLVFALTGIVYLFKPQLDDMMYPQQVVPQGAALPFTQQFAAATTAYPNSTISKVTPGATAARSTEIVLSTSNNRERTLFVDPYRGAVLGERDEQNNLQYYALKLHGELMLGVFGDTTMELAACWAIVLLVSGVFLWWPRKGAKIWGVLLPRLQWANQRLFWRDMHAVVGFWSALLILFMLLSGLPWAGFWGTQFSKLASSYPPQIWDDVPQSTVLTGTLNKASGTKTVSWATEQLPMPQSNPDAHAAHNHHAATNATIVSAGIDIDRVIALAQARGVAPGFSVSLPQNATGVYTVSLFPSDPTKEATLHIDRYSGEVLADVRWSDYGLAPKAVEMGVALHEGKYFGPLNQALMLVACLLVITVCVSGTVLWWRRRPEGRLGAPAMPHNFPLWKGATAIIVLLGAVFPLVGISLVAVLLLDFLLIRRVPVLRRVMN